MRDDHETELLIAGALRAHPPVRWALCSGACVQTNHPACQGRDTSRKKYRKSDELARPFARFSLGHRPEPSARAMQ
jgi:hypothetical protein